MELNHDCVRDSLLYLESNLGLTKGIIPEKVVESLENKYKQEETIYTLNKLREAGYIVGGFEIKSNPLGQTMIPGTIISDITWNGHAYLDNIRDEKVWKHVKSVTKQFSSVSLSILGNVASNYITSKLGL